MGHRDQISEYSGSSHRQPIYDNMVCATIVFMCLLGGCTALNSAPRIDAGTDRGSVGGETMEQAGVPLAVSAGRGPMALAWGGTPPTVPAEQGQEAVALVVTRLMVV
jgi:hypothetical protein